MVTGRPLFVAACKGMLICDKIPYFMEKFKDAFIFTDGGANEVEQIREILNDKGLREKKSKRAYEIVRSLKFNELTEIIGE